MKRAEGYLRAFLSSKRTKFSPPTKTLFLSAADVEGADSHLLKYDGSKESDVKIFLFKYENAVMHGQPNEEKCRSMLCHLEVPLLISITSITF